MIKIFSGSPPLLNYSNFCKSKTEKKLTTNFYVEEERARKKRQQ